jgi:hypothetical protein
MIYVDKTVNPDWATDAIWTALVEEARVARQKLVDDFTNDKELEIDPRMYKKFMPYLNKLFNGKCAYCETKISSNQPGDVEHFRPKGRVVDDKFKPIRLHHQQKGEIDHPGYFWLAYEWNNLLPSCIDCNRYRKHGDGPDTGAGKADRFPVENYRACSPGDEANEIALLVDPSDHEPSRRPEVHLEFKTNGGIRAKTKTGEITLKIFGLNRREPLVDARRRAYRIAEELFQSYLTAVISGNARKIKDLGPMINEIWFGRDVYAAVQRLAIEAAVEDYAKFQILISLPVPEEPFSIRHVQTSPVSEMATD